MRQLAQAVSVGGQRIYGPLEGINTIGDLINRLIAFILPLAGVILILIFIWGGYDLILSQGQPDKIKSAKAKITAGIIGFLLLIFSYVIVKLITTIFGFNAGSL